MKMKLLTSTFVFFFLISQAALAIPSQPNQFFGEARVNGQVVPDGTEVSAMIDGNVVETVTVEDGQYNLIVEDPDSDRSGKEVVFLIEGQDTGQNETFQNGAVDNIDLTASIEGFYETDDTDTGGSTGGGGSGGSYTGSTTEDETETEENETQNEENTDNATGDTGTVQHTEEDSCRERWTCTEWSSCEDGFQTRNCTDENNCGTEIYKPQETKPCSEPTEQGLTGLFFTTQGALVLGIIAFLGAGIAMTFFFKK